MKKFKQIHSPQVDTVNDNTGEEEYGYDKAEEIRTKQFNSSKDDYKAIWKMEGLE